MKTILSSVVALQVGFSPKPARLALRPDMVNVGETHTPTSGPTATSRLRRLLKTRRKVHKHKLKRARR